LSYKTTKNIILTYKSCDNNSFSTQLTCKTNDYLLDNTQTLLEFPNLILFPEFLPYGWLDLHLRFDFLINRSLQQKDNTLATAGQITLKDMQTWLHYITQKFFNVA